MIVGISFDIGRQGTARQTWHRPISVFSALSCVMPDPALLLRVGGRLGLITGSRTIRDFAAHRAGTPKRARRSKN
jgi:hypothetical protein